MANRGINFGWVSGNLRRNRRRGNQASQPGFNLSCFYLLAPELLHRPTCKTKTRKMFASSSRQTLSATSQRVLRAGERRSANVGSSSSRVSKPSLAGSARVSQRHLHATPVRWKEEEKKAKDKKEEVRFNFNTSLYFTEEPNPDVSC